MSAPMQSQGPVRSFSWTYIVCLDLNTPGWDYTPLNTELMASISWWHYMKNTWLVVRSDLLVELQDKLTTLIGDDDRFLILPAYGPGGGYLAKDAWDWINQTLPKAW
jgi:hypothetical protein